MLLPCLVAVLYREREGVYFLLVVAVCFVFGHVMSLHKPANTVFYLKEGCVATALSWIVLSIFGCLPFFISGCIPSFIDALFETVSGFTTTGSSILSDVEMLPRCMLFWRSFTHWIGGMGVLVFLLAIIPLSGGSNINLMRAESPGPSVGKLVPKVKYTARILYFIYCALTAAEIIFLMLGGLSVFEAVTTGFSTAGTGGFSITNDGLAGYTPYLQWVVTVFMVLFGVNFNMYYLIIYRKFKKALHMEEVRYYFLIIAAAVVLITVNTINITGNLFETITDSSFQVASIITTTGFATVDFNLWPQTSRTILVLLMFIGACAGSTGGGIKVSRIAIMVKTVFKELDTYLHPKSVRKINMEGRPVEHKVLRSVNVYLVSYVILFAVSTFLISLQGKDLITNFTAVAASFNNIGPGLEMVGPTQNYGFFNGLSKIVLIFDMIAGRLELFPLLMLCHPGIWKEMITHKKAMRRHS